MLIRAVKRNFSNFIKAQSNIKNLNSLIKYIDLNYEKFTNEDYISAMNKFQELEGNEINQKIKLYDFLDYIIADEKTLRDNLLIKTMMRIMIGNGLHDRSYWKLIKENLIKYNMVYTEKSDFLYYLKSFSIVEFDENNIWNIFEEFFLEKYFIFELYEIKQIALCFANIRKGTDQLWDKLFDLLDFDESKAIDFNLNFSISLMNYLSHIQDKDYLRKELFVNFINMSVNYINAFIKDYEYDPKQVIYSSFMEFHKAYFSFKLVNHYSIKADSFEFLVEELEKLFLNYLNKQVKSLKEEDIEGISKILLYFSSSENHQNFDLFDFNKYENTPNTIISSEDKKANDEVFKENKESAMKNRDLLIDAFGNNLNSFTKSSQIISFLKYFKQKRLEKTKIKEIIKNDHVWEKVIDDIHHFSIDELYNLSVLAKFFNVDYARLWIFLQTFIRNYFENSLEHNHNIPLDLILIEKFSDLYDKDNFRLKEFILLQFIYFLRRSKDCLIIKESHLKNGKIIDKNI